MEFTLFKISILLSFFVNKAFFIDFKVVGIFSICLDNYTQNELTRQAFIANETLGNIIKERSRVNPVMSYVNTTYHPYDVCFNDTKLASVVSSLLLSEEYNTLQNQTIYFTDQNQQVKSIDASKTTKILTIIAYVKEQPLQFMLDAFSMTNITISKYTNLVPTTIYYFVSCKWLSVLD